MNPRISVIICTYNGEHLIGNCLDSILKQNFRDFEVICVDGMSQDSTQQVIGSYMAFDPRIKLHINKKRLPEGKGYGKHQGYELARGEILAFIDQDNIIQDPNFFVKALQSFSENTLGILAGMKHDLKDQRLLRYVSLTGTDSFFAYRSIDFLRNLFKPSIKKIGMQTDNMLLTGGNCFFYKKTDIQAVGGFNQDVLIVRKLIEMGKNQLVILSNSTKHYAEKSLYSLIKKKFFWGSKFSSRSGEERFNYLPSSSRERHYFIKNLGFNLLVIPNIPRSLKLLKNSRDLISLIFPLMAFLNTIAYGSNFLKEKLRL